MAQMAVTRVSGGITVVAIPAHGAFDCVGCARGTVPELGDRLRAGRVHLESAHAHPFERNRGHTAGDPDANGVDPRSRGGDHSWENCVASCSTCNHRKADRLLSELGWSLRCVPSTPKGQHWRLLSTVKELDPAWVRYLDEGAA